MRIIKKVNNFWVDENNNSWECEKTTKKQAILYSKSLKNCQDCAECVNCSDCKDCIDCLNCKNCIKCYDCNNCDSCTNSCLECKYCHKCSGCEHCDGCHDCSLCDDCHCCNLCKLCSFCQYCKNCKSCHYCNECDNCSYCHNCMFCKKYTANPMRYVTKINRRNICFYYGKPRNGNSMQIVCGHPMGYTSVFKNLNRFQKSFLKKCENKEERDNCLKEIKKVKVLFEIK